MKIIAFIFAALLLTGCEPRVVNLDARVADPPYPPAFVQSSNCPLYGAIGGYQQTITCQFANPAAAQDHIFVIYSGTGTANIQDNGNDSFSPAISPISNGRESIYVYATTTQGASSVSVVPNAGSTAHLAAVLDLTGGSIVNQVQQNTTYTNYSQSCGPAWSCQTSPIPFQSPTVPITGPTILIGIQIGIYHACREEDEPPTPPTPANQEYLDTGSNCADGRGFAVLFGRPGSDSLCSQYCGFTVEYRVTSTPVSAPFWADTTPGWSAGASWTAAELAIQ